MFNKINVYEALLAKDKTQTIDVDYFQPYIDFTKWRKINPDTLSIVTREQAIASMMAGRGMTTVSFLGGSVVILTNDHCFGGYLGERRIIDYGFREEEEIDAYTLLPESFVPCSYTPRFVLGREHAEQLFQRQIYGYETVIDTRDKLFEYLRTGYPAWRKQAFQDFEKIRIEKKKKKNVISALKPTIECGTVEQPGAVVSVVKRSLRTRKIIQYSDGSCGFDFTRGHYAPYRDRRKAKRSMNRLTKKYRQGLKKGMLPQ